MSFFFPADWENPNHLYQPIRSEQSVDVYPYCEIQQMMSISCGDICAVKSSRDRIFICRNISPQQWKRKLNLFFKLREKKREIERERLRISGTFVPIALSLYWRAGNGISSVCQGAVKLGSSQLVFRESLIWCTIKWSSLHPERFWKPPLLSVLQHRCYGYCRIIMDFHQFGSFQISLQLWPWCLTGFDADVSCHMTQCTYLKWYGATLSSWRWL